MKTRACLGCGEPRHFVCDCPYHGGRPPSLVGCNRYPASRQIVRSSPQKLRASSPLILPDQRPESASFLRGGSRSWSARHVYNMISDDLQGRDLIEDILLLEFFFV